MAEAKTNLIIDEKTTEGKAEGAKKAMTAKNTGKKAGTKAAEKAENAKTTGKTADTKAAEKAENAKSTGKTARTKAAEKAETAKNTGKAASAKAKKPIKRIGVLTSGGDAPGMNAAIRAVVRTAIADGMEVIGIRRGFSGLIDEDFIELNGRSVTDTIQKGGTFLYTARCPEMITKEGQDKAAENCRKNGIEALVVIGGDGSFRGCQSLSDRGINVVGVPGTIDLDIACTEYTIGFDTAVNTAMEAIDKIRDTSTSQERCSIIEVMGRHAGFIALWCGLANGAEAVLTTELYKYEEQKLINDIQTKRKNGRKHYIIINAEGIGDSEDMAKRIEYATGMPTSATILGYLQRGGSPTCKDRVFASAMGAKAVDILYKGGSKRVVAYKNGAFVDYDMDEALAMKKTLDPFLVDMLSKLTRKGEGLLMKKEGMLPSTDETTGKRTIAVLTSGIDAPGMNAAIRAVVRTAIGYDMKVFGFKRGFAGLIEKDYIEMTNSTMSETVQKGGTLLLASECPEFLTEEGQKKAVATIKELHIDDLIVIGGNGTMRGGIDLMKYGINVVGIPATVDLDVACSEYTIGFDTAVNTAMEAIDKVRDTSQSHERCSVIEVSGKNSGFNALWCGIANGAEEIITPEYYDRNEQRIISEIINKKKIGKRLHLIVNAESVGRSASLAKNIEFATGLETRATVLGMLQRGGTPSCQDRVFASAMGGRAVEAINEGRTNRIVAFCNGEFVDFDIEKAMRMTKVPDLYMAEMSKKLSR